VRLRGFADLTIPYRGGNKMSATGKGQRPGAFDATEYRDNPSAIARYLDEVIRTGDSVLIAKAIGDMVRAQGVTKFSEKAGMRRDTLYRTFDGKSNPPLDRVINALLALGVQLKVTPKT
jgi:probable addiction module antidote protein